MTGTDQSLSVGEKWGFPLDERQPGADRDALPERRFPAHLRDMVEFAAASGDFNPIHFDPDAARASGLAGIIVPGLLKAAWLTDLAVDSVPPGYELVEFEASYRALDYVGQEYLVSGYREVHDEREVVLHLLGSNPDGKPTTIGQARFEHGRE
jgi:3-hydroxybutyryl-CoA dehydratase